MMIDLVAALLGSDFSFLAAFLVTVCAGLIVLGMRTYSRLHAVLQGLGFKLEIHGESEQSGENQDFEEEE